MNVLDVRLDNFYSFKNFHMNMTYPKRIVDSYIRDEHLEGRSNFRYKKVNILCGANASGKTTFGRMLMNIFNFMDKKNYETITDTISDCGKTASFEIDLASGEYVFYHIRCDVLPCGDQKYTSEHIRLHILKENIGIRDSYEACRKKVDKVAFSPADSYIEELDKISGLAWMFVYPLDSDKLIIFPDKDEMFRHILENVLKALDPAIESVGISQDADSAYVVRIQNESVVLQKSSWNSDLFSSGTKSGVKVAHFLFSLIKREHSFYYCDEIFSYIHSDVEKAVLSLMIDFIGPSDQLIFTTHNTDILDMNLPKHAFSFLRKDVSHEEMPITCVEASSFLKRNTDSLRNAVENDVFSTAPSLELIYDLESLAAGRDEDE